MSGHRQAAVALHALNLQDRDLILAELPVPDQAVLRGYLHELQSLGFEAATSELLAAATPVPATMNERLAQASPAALYAIFEHEPAALIAQFLAISNWCWSDGLLTMYTPARREQIRATGPLAVAPARQRFLVEAVSRRLSELANAPGTVPKQSMFASLLRLAKPWRR